MMHGHIYSDTAVAARQGGTGASLSYTSTSAGASGRKTGSTPSTGGMGFASLPRANTLSPFDAGVPAWSTVNQTDLFPFSSMSGDQIVEALNRAGSDFDAATGYGSGIGGGGGGGAGGSGGAAGTGGFTWDDGGAFDWMPQWSNWPDFGF